MFSRKPTVPRLSTVLPREAAEILWSASYEGTRRECSTAPAQLDEAINLVKRQWPEYFTVQPAAARAAD